MEQLKKNMSKWMAHKNSTNRIDIGYENTYYEPLKIPGHAPAFFGHRFDA